ncbi:MAG TPA: hypothetical protein VFR37_07790, partial [Longimicrobium sp.]|nr:hypothetical protein [Longimicrobium sp.]
MPWSLEIHHLGIGQGDSTLILAKEWDATDPNLLLRTRSALIDGGDWGASNVVIPYIRAQVSRLDVAVITHFDGDHYRGFTEMLEEGTRLIKHTRIYDQGRTAFDTEYEPQHADGKEAYRRYVRAIANAQGRRRHTLTRVTERVNSFFIMGLDDDRSYRKPQNGEFLIPNDLDGGAPVLPPDWLVGQEILWNGVVQPDGAPTILCIAANKWVLQADGETAFHSAVPINLMIDDPEDEDDEPMSMPEPVESVNCSENADSNGKSLAFLVDFGGFRYYLGGDL